MGSQYRSDEFKNPIFGRRVGGASGKYSRNFASLEDLDAWQVFPASCMPQSEPVQEESPWRVFRTHQARGFVDWAPL